MRQATTAAQIFKPHHYMRRTKPRFISEFGRPSPTFPFAHVFWHFLYLVLSCRAGPLDWSSALFGLTNAPTPADAR